MTLTSTSAALLCWRALELETILRRRQLAFHHVELLSQTAFSGEPTPTHGFRDLLEETRQRYSFVVVGYVVMPEHVHLLIGKPEKGTPSTVMQVLKQRFANSVLRARRRCSPSQALLWEPEAEHIWQPRFYDFNVWSQRKRVEKLRYMHENPVKRGLVLEPGEWAWSSFRDYAYDEPGRVKLNQWPAAKLKRIA